MQPFAGGSEAIVEAEVRHGQLARYHSEFFGEVIELNFDLGLAVVHALDDVPAAFGPQLEENR